MKCLLTFALISLVSAKLDLNNLTNPLQAIEELPSVVDSLPSIHEGEDLMKEKCLRNGNNDTYNNAMAAKEEFQTCIKGLFNFEQMQKEIEKATPTGDLDAVFKKYCKKSPELKVCVEAVTNATEPCLDPKEKDHKDVVLNITDSLLKFVCFKEGDRIALFIAEGGPECLKSKMDDVQKCLNDTMQGYEVDPAAGSLPELLLDEKQCGDFINLQKCVVNHLEKCKEPTPANIVGSLFDFVKKRTPCNQFSASVASSLPPAFLAVAAPIVAYALSKL